VSKPISTEKQREYHKTYRDKDPEKARRLHAERCKRYRERHPVRATKINGSYRKRNPEKAKAHGIVSYAIRKGHLVRQPCWCGNLKSQAHHADYSKPLEVVWLCQKHHKELHRKYQCS
jgi:hypothetical protein